MKNQCKLCGQIKGKRIHSCPSNPSLFLGAYAHKGAIPWNKGRKGVQIAWNKGKKNVYSEETLAKMRKPKSEFSRLKMSLAKKDNPNIMGVNNPAYKDGRAQNPRYHSFAVARYVANKRNAEGSHTFQEWEDLKKTYGYMCLCCKRQEPEIKLTEDHIIPLSKGGTDYIWNIQPLCKSCNSRKHVSEIDYRTILEL